MVLRSPADAGKFSSSFLSWHILSVYVFSRRCIVINLKPPAKSSIFLSICLGFSQIYSIIIVIIIIISSSSSSSSGSSKFSFWEERKLDNGWRDCHYLWFLIKIPLNQSFFLYNLCLRLIVYFSICLYLRGLILKKKEKKTKTDFFFINPCQYFRK